MSTSTQLPPPSKRAINLEGNKGIAVLFHGYTGTPYEVSTVAIALNKMGFSCFAPLLPKHGVAPQEINNLTVDELLDHAQQNIDKMDKIGNKPKILVGNSMGALLATIMAAKNNNKIDALILLSPAFSLQFAGKIATFLSYCGIYKFIPMVKKLAGGSDVANERAKKLNPCNKYIPIKGLIALNKLKKLALSKINQVSCPVFIACGKKDKTVKITKAKRCFSKFTTPAKEFHLLEKSQHIIALDYEHEQLTELISEFIKKNGLKKANNIK